MTEEQQLAQLAVTIREDVLRMTHAAGNGHPGGSLSAADYLVWLYSKELNVRPEEPDWAERDRFVLSKGHVVPALYAVLAHKGYFPVEDLITLRKPDSHLQGHPNMHDTPGIDMSSGSLGQGIGAAAGMAKGAKVLGEKLSVHVLLGDGECAEGEVWEAALYAAHYKLDNLCVAVDVNGLQIDGTTAEVMNTSPLDAKFEAFGFDVITVDGHDFADLAKGFARFHENQGSGRPTAILMKTVKGKGVSFMENNAGWHGKAPNDAELEQGLKELAAVRQQLEEV